MWRWQRRLLVAVAVLFCATPVSVMVSDHVFDLVAVSRLPDGEVETRVRYGKMTAKETVAASKEPFWETGFPNRGVTLRELCAGHHLIQLIYAPSGELLDCEYGKQVERSRTFILDFEHTLSNLSNATVQSLEGRQLPIEYSWMNYTKLRSNCRLRHKELEEEAWMRRIKVHRDRSKRDISDLLLVPGTQWCGKGYSADKYTRLGGFSRTDKCCRKHDLSCPFWIGGFETKYGLFNWRLNTLMHCRCDERFRACLKRVGTSDANLVGKLFFNVVQTKCFVLKPKKKCHRSWWGKCEKYKIVKQAILRDNQPY